MKRFKFFVGLALLSSVHCTQSMRSRSSTRKEVIRVVITRETVAQYKETFPAFLKSKEGELKTLREWTGDGWFGSMCTYAIESFGPLLGIGNVDVKKAKVFLGRVFADDKKLQETIDGFEKLDDNIIYLKNVFEKVNDDTLRKRHRPGLIEVIRNERHKRVPVPDDMGIKKIDGTYVIADNDFLPYGVCNLFACHILESCNTCPTPRSTMPESYESSKH